MREVFPTRCVSLFSFCDDSLSISLELSTISCLPLVSFSPTIPPFFFGVSRSRYVSHHIGLCPTTFYPCPAQQRDRSLPRHLAPRSHLVHESVLRWLEKRRQASQIPLWTFSSGSDPVSINTTFLPPLPPHAFFCFGQRFVDLLHTKFQTTCQFFLGSVFPLFFP